MNAVLPRLLTLLLTFSFYFITAQVTDPVVTSWIQTPGQTGYTGIASNVQSVNYTTTDVYVSCTCIPGYDIGPWAGNPNVAANQNFCFKITRNPQQNTGTLTSAGLGHIGVWTNGVSIFSASDGQSYNNQGVWNRNAYYWEGPSFDDCLGHPQQNGEYHHHVNPRCLYNDLDNAVHSPIIGWAFDGFPVYGAYAYTNTNGTGAIKRMETSYQLRNISQRTTLPNGSTASSAGPAVSGQYPLGAYQEDYEYVQGLGDLDENNGRFAVTPDYPNGIYAYYVTIDANIDPAYPYTIGAHYYGTVQQGNTGPQSGHNTIPGTAVTYVPDTATGIALVDISTQAGLYPNPATQFITLDFSALSTASWSVEVLDLTGKLYSYTTSDKAQIQVPVSELPQGVYIVKAIAENGYLYRGKFLRR